MAKAIKAAVIAAVIVFTVGAATVGFAASGMGAITFGTGLGLTATGMAVFTFATTLISAGIGMMTSKGIEANQGNFGSKASAKGALNPRQIIYGETRVGGTITFLRTTGVDNNKMSMMVVLSGHPVESIESINFGDTALSLTSSTSSGAGTDNKIYTVTNSDYTNNDNANNFGSGRLVRLTLSDGSQTAINSLARTTHGSTVIDNNFKLTNCAYIYLEMIYDAEKMPAVPKITAIVKGKKLYDPRLDSTAGGSGSHRLTDASTHAWSDNPVLQLLDFLSDTTYGLKATSTELNLSANAGGFMSAANTCEQNVSLGGVTEKRYTGNGFTNMSANGTGVIEGILSACGGKMTFTNGKFNVFVAAAQTPALTITDDDLLSAVTISRNTQSNELFNSVKSIFVDKNNGFVGTDTPEIANSTFLDEDTPDGESTTNYKKRMEVQLPYTQTVTTAERLAKIALQHQRKTMQVNLLTTTKFMRLQPCDFVYITNERMDWTQQMFEVVSTQLTIAESDGVPIAGTQLVLKEIDAATYDFASNEYVTPITQGPVSEIPAGDYAVTAPSGLATAQILTLDGTTSKINIKATWTNNTSPYIFATEIAYKLNGEADALNRSITVGAGTTTAYLPNVTVGEVYNVKARHVSSRGVYSAYTSAVNITIAASTSAPAVPSSASVSTGKPLNMIITYTNPNNSDLKAVKIYRKTSNSTPSSDSDGLVNTQYGSPNSISTWIDGQVNGLSAGTTYYYWIRAVNHSDGHSAFVAVGAGNFTTVTSAESIVSNIDRASFFYQSKTGNTNAPSNSEFSAISGRNPVTNDMIIVTRTDTNPDQSKAYKYGGSSWSEVSNLVSGDMMVDGTIGASKIVADAITSDKIDVSTLSAISANVGTLNAGTINGTNMSITNLSASNIDAGTLNANRLNLNGTTLTVTSNGLQVGTFDGTAHVNANSIGSVLFAEADKLDFTYHNTSFTDFDTDYAAGRLKPLLSSPITLTIPATKTAVAKAFAAIGTYNTIGSTFGSALKIKTIILAISTSSDPSSDNSHTETELFTAFGSGGALVLASTTLKKGFNVTTSTSGTVTRYIHAYGFLQNVTGTGYNGFNDASTGDLGFTIDVSVQGLFR